MSEKVRNRIADKLERIIGEYPIAIDDSSDLEAVRFVVSGLVDVLVSSAFGGILGSLDGEDAFSFLVEDCQDFGADLSLRSYDDFEDDDVSKLDERYQSIRVQVEDFVQLLRAGFDK